MIKKDRNEQIVNYQLFFTLSSTLTSRETFIYSFIPLISEINVYFNPYGARSRNPRFDLTMIALQYRAVLPVSTLSRFPRIHPHKALNPLHALICHSNVGSPENPSSRSIWRRRTKQNSRAIWQQLQRTRVSRGSLSIATYCERLSTRAEQKDPRGGEAPLRSMNARRQQPVGSIVSTRAVSSGRERIDAHALRGLCISTVGRKFASRFSRAASARARKHACTAP